MKNVAVLHGSLGGPAGNTSAVVDRLVEPLLSQCTMDHIHLHEIDNHLGLKPRMANADGFIIATGIYWQSWGSPLQRFLEQTTEWEGNPVWLGKPACVVVTMHSIGGMGVISRLQSNLSLLGALIPPQCSIAHSFVNQEARKSSDSDDIWDLKYLPTITHNFLTALNGRQDYVSWAVDDVERISDRWIE